MHQREAAADRGADRKPVGDQRGGVVEEALALGCADQAPRHVEAPHDRGGREGVGRGYDGPQREGRRPRQAADQRVRDERDHDHRREHQPDGAQRDPAQVGADVVQVREERCAVEEGRQEDDEHDVRIELHLGEPRHEAEQGPTDDQDHRVGDREPARERAETGHGDQQSGD